jgi:hypothetical protein
MGRWSLSLAATGALILLAGCASSRAVRPEVLQSFVGRPATALEKEWGPATREVADGGQRLLIYEEFDRKDSVDVARSEGTARSATQTYVQTQANATVNPGRVYARSYQFWVDAAGTIVRVNVKER